MSGGQLAGGNSAGERAKDDYYATAPETALMFLNRFRSDGEDLGKAVWEPACGGGNICRAVSEVFPECSIRASDIIDRGYPGTEILDFRLAGDGFRPDSIITNPPFSLMNEFIERGLEVLGTGGRLIFFAKVQTLEGTSRRRLLENAGLKYVYVHSSRQATWKNGEPRMENGNRWTTTMCMAWFVWEKGHRGEPVLRFL